MKKFTTNRKYPSNFGGTSIFFLACFLSPVVVKCSSDWGDFFSESFWNESEEFTEFTPVDAPHSANSTGMFVKFQHEACIEAVVVGGISLDNSYFPIKQSGVGKIRSLVRFRGKSDAHIILSPINKESDQHYIIGVGVDGNDRTHFRSSRRGNPAVLVGSISTPGILSEHLYRGFIIEYTFASGHLMIYSEKGGNGPILSWKDPNPLNIQFISFSANNDVTLHVAFQCHELDSKSFVVAEEASTSSFNRVGSSHKALDHNPFDSKMEANRYN